MKYAVFLFLLALSPACDGPVVPRDAGPEASPPVVSTPVPVDSGTGCPVGETRCGAICVDLQRNPHHCGTCDNACLYADEPCTHGICPYSQFHCPDGLTQCSPTFCSNLVYDDANCGACGHACRDGQICMDSQCRDFDTPFCTGLTVCGDACVDLQSDDANCGVCGHACRAAEQCVAGVCAISCAPSFTVCNGVCAATSYDRANCGACGHACGNSEVCVAGVCTVGQTCPSPLVVCNGLCTYTARDDANCGACGHACGAGTYCADGACLSTAAEITGESCDTMTACGPGGACLPPSFGWTDGYCTYLCAGPGTCNARSTCVGSATFGVCLRSCTRSEDCRAGYACDPATGTCQPGCAGRAEICGPYLCNGSTGACTSACDADGDCSAGSTCDTSSRTCRCTSATVCAADLACNAFSGQCGCTSNTACLPGTRCDTTLGACTR